MTVEGYTGTVGGASFKDGVPQGGAEVTPALRRYFGTVGYRVQGGRVVRGTADPTPEPPDPRFVAQGKVGTALRDAAVDPRPGDYLPPSNAGHANPHGPEVVSPEIHGSQGVKPIVPGRVPDAAAQQEAKELAATEAAAAAEPAPVTAGRPAGNDSADVWRQYAIDTGADPAEVADLSRNELRERYGKDA
jgi:hypothetical protein